LKGKEDINSTISRVIVVLDINSMGNTHLGGEGIDNEMVNYVVE